MGFFGWVFYCQPCLKVEDSSITLLQNIQQPLPQSALLSPSVPLELLAAASSSSSSSFPSASILTSGSSSLASASFLSNTSSGDSSSLSNLTNTSLASVYTVTPTTLPAAMSSVPSSAAAVNFRTGTPLLASSSSYPSFSSGMSAVSTAPNSGTGTIATAAAGSSVTFSSGSAAGPPVTAAVLEDADEQISQLIRTLQQKPLSDERISRIFQQAQRPGAAAATAVSTAGGAQAGPPAVNAANLLKASLLAAKAGGGIFGENAVAAASSPAMPVLTPQVALSAEEPPSAAAGFQNSYLDSLARSQITDKRSVSSARPRHLSSSSSSASVVVGGVQTTTAAAAGGRSFHQQQPPPLLSPTGGLGGSAPRLSAAFAAASPTILQGGKVSVPTVIQQNPRFDVAAAPHQAAAAPITLQTVSSGVGGVGSQIRAMQQHVQPNTRLMRGPNGQVTVQKVQTIELSQENQQVRNSLPNK